MNAATLIIDSRQALVFDLDGTLADTVADLWYALNDALKELGLPVVTLDLVLDSLHGGLPETARRALDRHGVPPAGAERLCGLYADFYRQRDHAASKLYPGVRSFLDRCLERRVPMAVCTNKSRDEAVVLLERLGVAHHFASVVGGDSSPHLKPHPAPLLQALRDLGAEPEQAVMIGDSQVDAHCAELAGVDFVLHSSGYGALQAVRHAVAASFGSYLDLVVPFGGASQ